MYEFVFSHVFSDLSIITDCLLNTAQCYASDLPVYTPLKEYWYRIRAPLDYICGAGSRGNVRPIHNLI